MVNPNIFNYEMLQQGAEFINGMARIRGLDIERRMDGNIILYVILRGDEVLHSLHTQDDAMSADEQLQNDVAEWLIANIPITGALS